MTPEEFQKYYLRLLGWIDATLRAHAENAQAEETISANFLQQLNPNAVWKQSGSSRGLNSTRAFSAASKMNNNGSNLVVDFPPALYILAPSLGLNVLAELESSNATNANVYQGGSSQIMNLQATWRG